MSFVDWLIVAAYFGGIAALTAWVVKRHRDTADDYFLASRNLGWFVFVSILFFVGMMCAVLLFGE